MSERKLDSEEVAHLIDYLDEAMLSVTDSLSGEVCFRSVRIIEMDMLRRAMRELQSISPASPEVLDAAERVRRTVAADNLEVSPEVEVLIDFALAVLAGQGKIKEE